MIAFEAGTRVHFVGIGGVSMSALAEVLHHRGCRVSGSDRQPSALTRKLETLGIQVQIGHTGSAVEGVDCVIYTSATNAQNPERKAAQAQGITLLRRAELLGRLTASHPTICVAGTHGKTTTTAMVAGVLEAAGCDPTALVGGVVQTWQSTLRIGQGTHWVVEADEYDRSFLTLKPDLAVVTSLEADHLDCYRDLEDIRLAFAQFVNALPDNGCAILCVDGSEVGTLDLHNRYHHLTYGLTRGHIRAQNIEQAGFGSAFDVFENDKHSGHLRLQIPGQHNVANALAAVGVGKHLGLAWPDIENGLAAFKGVHRRFDVLGEVQGIVVVDDYAHHPTEIRATLEAARRGWAGRIVAAFQPHLYTRTRDFATEFARALQLADRIWITEIYPAREEPIPGVTGQTLANRISGATFAPTLDDLKENLLADLRPGDLLVVMGAGDIERVAYEVYGGLS